MTYSMSTAAARKASKKTQHVRSAGDWITLILLVAGALLVLFPLLVLTVNAFKTSADYNATDPGVYPDASAVQVKFWRRRHHSGFGCVPLGNNLKSRVLPRSGFFIYNVLRIEPDFSGCVPSLNVNRFAFDFPV